MGDVDAGCKRARPHVMLSPGQCGGKEGKP